MMIENEHKIEEWKKREREKLLEWLKEMWID